MMFPMAMNWRRFALLAEEMAQLAREAAEDATSEPAVFTSTSLPPDVRTRETFAKLCRKIPGAKKQGNCWRVPVADWEQFRSKKPVVKKTKITVPSVKQISVSIDEVLQRSGLRPIGGSTRN